MLSFDEWKDFTPINFGADDVKSVAYVKNLFLLGNETGPCIFIDDKAIVEDIVEYIENDIIYYGDYNPTDGIDGGQSVSLWFILNDGTKRTVSYTTDHLSYNEETYSIKSINNLMINLYDKLLSKYNPVEVSSVGDPWEAIDTSE